MQAGSGARGHPVRIPEQRTYVSPFDSRDADHVTEQLRTSMASYGVHPDDVDIDVWLDSDGGLHLTARAPHPP